MTDTTAPRAAPPGWFIDACMPIWRARAVAAGQTVAMRAFLNAPDPRPAALPACVEKDIRANGADSGAVDQLVVECGLGPEAIPALMATMATFLREIAPLLTEAAVDAARARWKDQLAALSDPRTGPLMRQVLEALGPAGPMGRSEGKAP